MRVLRTGLILGCFLLLALPTWGAKKRSGAGFGIESGIVESDLLLNEIDFVGYSAFYKFGITDKWGVLFSFRILEDDENFLFMEEDEYTQIGAEAVYMWRAGKKVRPHVKFGVAHTDFEAKVPGASASDSGVSFSFGGGLEAGSERLAFFGDFGYSEPEIKLEGVSQDLEIGNLTLGIIFKF